MMKVALIQMNSGHDKVANLAAAARLIEQAVTDERPDWIGLPEVFDSLGGSPADKIAAAETLPGGPAYKMLQDLARRHGVFIHGGSILERSGDNSRLHNTTLVFDRSGAEIARYRKIHMFDITTPDGHVYNESATFAPGDELATYRCGDMLIGCAICYDLRFPMLFQKLAEAGVDMIALPSAFTLQTGRDHWDVLVRARAIETQTWLCAPAQWGTFSAGNGTRQTFGHSLVADPWGQIIASAPDGVGFISARLDPKRAAHVRALMPVADHRVPLPKV